MKIFVAGIETETNTFSPIPTGMDDFTIVRPDDISNGTASLSDGPPYAQWQIKAEARKDELIFGFYAYAPPAGPTGKAVYESLRDELLSELRKAGSVDIVLLNLHGAMVAHGYDDAEGDLITSVRDIVGPNVVIGVELDLHCHLTALMIDKANIIITYKEYPHVDIGARGEELYDLAADTRLGHSHPVMAVFDCKMVGMYPTSTPEMRGFIETMVAAEQKRDILSVSFGHGFSFGDIADAGGKIIVVADNNLPLAEQQAKSLGRQLFGLRHHINFKALSMDEALSKAQSIINHRANDKPKPVVVADQSDNAGAGAPSDSTFALQWLLEHQVRNAAIAMFYDPQVVKLAIAAGTDAQLQVRLGGKMGVSSGDPLDLLVKVIAIERKYTHKFPQDDGSVSLIPVGDTVALHCAGIDIVVISQRTQCRSPCIFDDLGITASKKSLLVVKSMQHFYGAFSPIASEVIYMAAPGAVPPVVKQIPYKNMSTDDKFPWVENPFEVSTN